MILNDSIALCFTVSMKIKHLSTEKAIAQSKAIKVDTKNEDTLYDPS